MRNALFMFVVISALSWGCSTEVELNAPYKSTTHLFGLLDPAADTQWVKINKTFLGDGNNLEYAQIRDSSEYDFSEFKRLVVEEWNNGSLVNEFPLAEIEVENKSLNGIFYAPLQTVYFFETPPGGLNQSSIYRIVVDFHTKQDVYAETNLVGVSGIGFQTPQTGTTISLAQTAIGNTVNYNENVNVKWSPGENTVLYDLTLRFHYKEKKYAEPEHINLISETDQFIDWSIGTFNESNLQQQAGFLSASFNAEPFFSYIGSVLDSDPNVVREIGYYDVDDQKTRCFDVFLSLANEELQTYISVGTPVTGIIQERPVYTNVANGLGLFASRSRTGVYDLSLIGGNQAQTGNLIALVLGEYTLDLGFCDPNPNSTYSCE